MWNLKDILKAVIYTILEVIFVVICGKVFEFSKVDEVIILFEILIILTLIVCAIAIINTIKDNRN